MATAATDVNAAVEAAQALLGLRCNDKGFEQQWREKRARLDTSMASLRPPSSLGGAEATPSMTQRLLRAMDRAAVPRTPSTWKPYVLLVMKALGVGEAELRSAEQKARLRHSAIVEAEAVALGPCPEASSTALVAAVPTMAQQASRKRRPAVTMEDKGSGGKRQQLLDFWARKPAAQPNTGTALVAEEPLPLPGPMAPSLCVADAVPLPAPAICAEESSRAVCAIEGSADSCEPLSRTPPELRAALSESAALTSTTYSTAAPDQRARKHYQTLGLEPGASLPDIRAAYRRRALATHPDKCGGSSVAFRAVVDAFEALSEDAVQKPATQHQETPLEDAGMQGGTAMEAAKAICAILATSSERAWPRLLGALGTPVLDALLVFLRSSASCAAGANQRRASRAEASGTAGDLLDTRRDDSTALPSRGIFRKGAGYQVAVSWRNFSVQTGAVWSIEQAINLHILLVQVRDAALARWRAAVSELQLASHSSAASGCATDDGCPPLLESELSEVMREEPLVTLAFTSDLRSSGATARRIHTPSTPNLSTALHFRNLVRQALACPTPSPEQISDVKRLMQHRALEERQQRQHVERALERAATIEADARTASASSFQVVPKAERQEGRTAPRPGSPQRQGRLCQGRALEMTSDVVLWHQDELPAEAELQIAPRQEEPAVQLLALREDVSSMRKELRLSTEVNDLRTALQAAQSERAAAVARGDALQAECQAQREQLQSARKEVALAQRRADRFREERTAAQVDAAATAAGMDAQQNKELRQHNKELEEELLKVQEENRRLDKALKTLLKEKASARAPGARSAPVEDKGREAELRQERLLKELGSFRNLR